MHLLFVDLKHEVKKPTEVPVAPKEAERQLSKRERKNKLAELKAFLADFAVTQKRVMDKMKHKVSATICHMIL